MVQLWGLVVPPGEIIRPRPLPAASKGLGLVARNGSGIDTITNIKGKRIALLRGTILQLSLNSILERQNLTEKDVKLFDLITADQISAVQSGDVDAVVGTSSALTLVERGLAKVAFSTKGKPDPASNFGSFIVLDEFARKYPQTTRRVLTAYLRAAYFASQEENRSELYDIWARAGISRAIVAAEYDDDSLRERASPLLDPFYVANVIVFEITFDLEHAERARPEERALGVSRAGEADDFRGRFLGETGVRRDSQGEQQHYGAGPTGTEQECRHGAPSFQAGRRDPGALPASVWKTK
jgi:hypothetical protein